MHLLSLKRLLWKFFNTFVESWKFKVGVGQFPQQALLFFKVESGCGKPFAKPAFNVFERFITTKGLKQWQDWLINTLRSFECEIKSQPGRQYTKPDALSQQLTSEIPIIHFSILNTTWHFFPPPPAHILLIPSNHFNLSLFLWVIQFFH